MQKNLLLFTLPWIVSTYDIYHMQDKRTNLTTAMLKICFLFALPWRTFAYENVALRKRAWQVHPYENPNLRDYMNASKAVDGLKTDLSFSEHQCTQSANFKDQALWAVDLGRVLGIHHITIYYRTDNVPWGPNHGYSGRFLGFSVYISNTTGKDDGFLCFKDDKFTKYTIPAVLTLNCTHHGRYVIYYNNRTSTSKPADYSRYAYNELCEFEVYGCSTPNHYGENCHLLCPDSCIKSHCHIETGYCFGCKDGYQGPKCEQLNVALNKPAYQQHPHKAGDNKFDASNAVDGSKSDLRRWGGQCAVSADDKETATWWVNLTSIHSVHHITIHYMTNNKEWGPFNYFAHYFLGFSVYVSNTPDISEGKLCFKDSNFTLNTIPAVFTTTCLVHGQYVIYYNERLSGVIYPNGYSEYARIDLCEVEVFECDDGTFGTDCSGVCGHCHRGAQCDKSTGMCASGCAPGYEGIYCNKTCASMRYGPNCELTCKMNCLNQTCDSKSGTCPVTESIVHVVENNKNNIMILVIGGSSGALCLLIIFVSSLYKRIIRKRCQSSMPKKTILKRKTYENTDLDLNIVEPSRRLIERHVNAIDKNSYEQIHIQSSAENMCTYDELFAIPINDTESISITTDEESRSPFNKGKIYMNCTKNGVHTTRPYNQTRGHPELCTGKLGNYINVHFNGK